MKSKQIAKTIVLASALAFTLPSVGDLSSPVKHTSIQAFSSLEAHAAIKKIKDEMGVVTILENTAVHAKTTRGNNVFLPTKANPITIKNKMGDDKSVKTVITVPENGYVSIIGLAKKGKTSYFKVAYKSKTGYVTLDIIDQNTKAAVKTTKTDNENVNAASIVKLNGPAAISAALTRMKTTTDTQGYKSPMATADNKSVAIKKDQVLSITATVKIGKTTYYKTVNPTNSSKTAIYVKADNSLKTLETKMSRLANGFSFQLKPNLKGNAITLRNATGTDRATKAIVKLDKNAKITGVGPTASIIDTFNGIEYMYVVAKVKNKTYVGFIPYSSLTEK